MTVDEALDAFERKWSRVALEGSAFDAREVCSQMLFDLRSLRAAFPAAAVDREATTEPAPPPSSRETQETIPDGRHQ